MGERHHLRTVSASSLTFLTCFVVPTGGFAPPASLCDALGGHGALFGTCVYPPDDVAASFNVHRASYSPDTPLDDDDAVFLQVASDLLPGPVDGADADWDTEWTWPRWTG